MATLAESFLADLDDLDDDSGAEEELQDQDKEEDGAAPVCCCCLCIKKFEVWCMSTAHPCNLLA